VQPICYWYFFNGLTVGSLELYKNNELIWSVSAVVPAWKKAVVSFQRGTFTVK
jgi:hypothetical protein